MRPHLVDADMLEVMANALENALQKALSVRLNLQISLSQLPIVEEWMDIHLDRWLEHNPTPPDMPDGEGISYLVMLGSDLRRIWWGAWGDPRGFVPKMADYFKLCNIAKSDAAVLDQIGERLEPKLVGSWIGVWGGKVTTGWHFWDPHPWSKVELMFGTHEAKYQLKKWVDDHHIERIERFSQSIGDAAYSAIELAVPRAPIDEQVDAPGTEPGSMCISSRPTPPRRDRSRRRRKRTERDAARRLPARERRCADRAVRGRSLPGVGPGRPASQQDRERRAASPQAVGRIGDRRAQAAHRVH